MALLRSALFEIAYWLVTISFAIFCALLAALPGKRALELWPVHLWTRDGFHHARPGRYPH